MKIPKYCSQDGRELIEQTKIYEAGYDPYTGEKKPDYTYHYLVCPQSDHDRYLLVNGEWIKA